MPTVNAVARSVQPVSNRAPRERTKSDERKTFKTPLKRKVFEKFSSPVSEVTERSYGVFEKAPISNRLPYWVFTGPPRTQRKNLQNTGKIGGTASRSLSRSPSYSKYLLAPKNTSLLQQTTLTGFSLMPRTYCQKGGEEIGC